MLSILKYLIFILLNFTVSFSWGQRIYASNSVLSTGNWYKISILQSGVYKIDVPFLSKLGLSGSIPSNQIKIFGNGGQMLPESNSIPRIDDLQEIAIDIEDGGDGVLNGTDYILFYAEGTNYWKKDSVNKGFTHVKNVYTDKSYYYITIGSANIKVPNQAPFQNATTLVNSYNERFAHELDSINFLSSGKEWFGEELSNSPGRKSVQSFNLPFNDYSGNGTLITSIAARSVNVSASVGISVGSQSIKQVNFSPITTGIYDLFAQEVQSRSDFLIASNTSQIAFSYLQGSSNSQAWINWFEFYARRPLGFTPDHQLLFRDWNSVGNQAAEFVINNATSDCIVWDITNKSFPIKMLTTISGSQLHFINDAQTLHEYICFSNFLLPTIEGKINNQNLHNTTEADLIIVTNPSFLQQAQALASFHQQHDHFNIAIATTDQIYNEFSSGIPDLVAIRDFIKMYYDRYKSSWNQSGKYLLLFGKASFDYKNRIINNTNLVPGYESISSLDPLTTYTSDDFFGFLDDNEDINSSIVLNTLDIGIGRIPAKNQDEAKNFINKVLEYSSSPAMGPWRNNMDFIADDGDQNLHLEDAETITSTVSATAPIYNLRKIYLDAFKKEGGSGGGSYPQANTAISNNLYNGTLIWNYNGHGGSTRLAEEDILDQQIINNINNEFKLPLFITATCDFAPFDNPIVNSLGENLLIRPKTGAIALMTTTRPVFAFSNRILNNNYLSIALQKDTSGNYRSLGMAMKDAKNYTYLNSSDIINNRKFTLLGDPALTLSFPINQVVPETVNNISISSQVDTIKATQFVTITGEVKDSKGNLLNNFNGTVYLTLYDKPGTIMTLGNDPSSFPVSFSTQENILFKGKATSKNGEYSFRFRLPKDINFQYGNGKISLYAQDGVIDGNGFSTKIIIGGISNEHLTDNLGPQIKAYLNDKKFVNGGISNNDPILLADLEDSSGINTGSSGIGHDISVTIDNDSHSYYVLNNYYESETDNYQKGSLRFQLPVLSAGHHTLKIKAWDVLNNSSESTLDFTVINDDKLVLSHVLNYPNPFTTSTSFWFEHNFPDVDLYTKIEIFTVSGKLIKTLTRTINTPGNRSSDVTWDGTDEFGAKIGRGVYIYRLRVKTADGKTAEKWERLVILK